MGRTLPPFTQVLEQVQAELAPYRRALRRADREALDRIFDRAKQQVAACAYAAHPWPMDLILVSALLEQEKLIGELPGLRARLEALERELSVLRGDADENGQGRLL